MQQDSRQTVLFEGLFAKPTIITFDAEAQSSDGGLVLLRAVDQRLRLTERMATILRDRREQARVEHSLLEMLRQRVFFISGGYADGNDAARVGDDPVFKEVSGRSPLEDSALASQPTLSRFENAVTGRELVRLGRALTDLVIERHRRRLKGNARRITIDLDPTDDPAHGQQAFAFFNGHYDNHCFLPLLGFLTFDDEPDQYLFHARLRPGNATAPRGAPRLLGRVVKQLRGAFPKARIRVRLDGGYASPLIFATLEKLKVEYVVGMPENARLKAMAEPFLAEARARATASGRTEQVFGSFMYAPKSSWPHERRVIVKAEVTIQPGREPRDNPRFVVTNLKGGPESVYDVYRGRGEIENRIKELHHGLEIDRTSCSRFLANQFRVLMTAIAYVLFQELRLAARRTELARAQVSTLRERLLKIGARVVESVRRVVLHFPSAYAWSALWRRVALAVGAVAT